MKKKVNEDVEVNLSNNIANSEQSAGTFRETEQVEENNIVGKVFLFDMKPDALYFAIQSIDSFFSSRKVIFEWLLFISTAVIFRTQSHAQRNQYDHFCIYSLFFL